MKSHARSFNDFKLREVEGIEIPSLKLPNWNKNVTSGPSIVLVCGIENVLLLITTIIDWKRVWLSFNDWMERAMLR